MSKALDSAQALLGVSLCIHGKDYGTVCDIHIVSTGYESTIVLVTDSGKRLESRSVLSYLKLQDKKINHSVDDLGEKIDHSKHYPDGSTFSQYFAGPKGLYRAEPFAAAHIDNTVRVNNQTIKITEHLCSDRVIDGVEE